MSTEQLNARTRYLAFPFRMSPQGSDQSGRQAHIREQIAQLLYTQPGERVFLPAFGIGLAQLLFMPMTDSLWRRIEITLASGLAEALKGEVQPDSILVRAGPAPSDPATLQITVQYRLAALNLSEKMQFDITEGALELPKQGEAG